MSDSVAEIKRFYPKLWEKFYPRTYKNTDRWPSPKLVAKDLASIAIDFQADLVSYPDLAKFDNIFQAWPDLPLDVGTRSGVMRFTAEPLAALRMPTFFVSEDLAQAIWETVPPITLDYMTMKLPFEAAVIILPKGTIVHPTRGEIPYITYSRVAPQTGSDGRVFQGMIDVLSVSQGDPYVNHFLCDKEHFPSIDLRRLNEEVVREDRPAPYAADGDHAVRAAMLHYLFGLLLVMNSRPDLVEMGRSVGSKLTKRGTELWTPNIIGARYQVKRSPSSVEPTSGIAKRAHWRRGHWREQAYGPAFSLHKHIWIEPVLVVGSKAAGGGA